MVYWPNCSTGLRLFCLSTAFIFHLNFADPMQKISFLKNIGLGILLLAVGYFIHRYFVNFLS